MSLDFQQFRNQLLSTADVLDVVRERVELRRTGTRWVGRCPFHNEKTASFGVTPAMQIFKCFGCGAGGNAIDFVMRYDDMTFWEACKMLAERYGIPLPARSPDNDPKSKTRAGIYEAHEIAQRLYRAALQSQAGAQAREYLERRGVSPEIAEEFGLGLSDRNGQGLTRKLQQEGFTPEQLLETGLVGQREGGGGFYDRFRGRLMFPIQNEHGKVIGYGGRALSDDDQPKYLNSPETGLYRKSFVLYNLHRARKPVREFGHAILVEGYMDVIGLAGGGVGESVASCGTSLVDTQVRMIHRYTDNIIVNFDSDAAGVAAAERSIQILLREGIHIRVLELPGNVDPDEFIQESGAENYRQLLATAPRYFHWMRDRLRQRYDMRSAEGRAEAVRELLPFIRVLPDKFERAAVAAELAHDLSIDKALLLEQVKGGAASHGAASPARPARPRVDLPPNERVLLHHLLHSPEARQEALPRLAELLEKPGYESIASHPILAALLDLGADFAYERLEERLSDRDKSLLASLIFADESSKVSELGDDNAVAQVLGCLDRLEQDVERAAMDDLKVRIRTAEESGKIEEALALSEELQRLTRLDARRRARPPD